jgi:hypothetical protein
MGLESLDDTIPKDSDPVSAGAGAIRDTRAATISSFGIEHVLTGQHKIPQNTTALRPVAGQAGRLFWNTDHHWLEFDNGTQWVTLAGHTATATILYHNADITVPVNTGGPAFEIPFDVVLVDPGGFANAGSHQILMPPNSIGTTYLNLSTSAANGGYGAIVAIEQYETASAGWHPIAQGFYEGPLASFWNLTSIVDSAQGVNLRGTILNGTGNVMTISFTSLGGSPRLGYVCQGTVS